MFQIAATDGDFRHKLYCNVPKTKGEMCPQNIKVRGSKTRTNKTRQIESGDLLALRNGRLFDRFLF